MKIKEADIKHAAAAMGRKGGKSKSPAKVKAAKKNIQAAHKGRDKRFANMTPAERSARAKKAADARWSGIVKK